MMPQSLTNGFSIFYLTKVLLLDIVLVFGGSHNKIQHRLCGLKSRNLFSHSSWSWKFEIRVPVWQISVENSHSELLMGIFSLHPLGRKGQTENMVSRVSLKGH